MEQHLVNKDVTHAIEAIMSAIRDDDPFPHLVIDDFCLQIFTSAIYELLTAETTISNIIPATKTLLVMQLN